MRFRVVSILALLLAGAAAEARSQVRGLPLYAVQVPKGITLAGDAGFPSNDLCPSACVGFSAAAGFGRIGAAATVATSGFGGLVSVTLLHAERSPFALVLQGGVSWSGTSDNAAFQAPIGTGFSVWIPTPIASVQSWIGVRGQYMDPSADTAGGAAFHPAFSAGLGITLLNGLGVRAAYDRVFLADYNQSTFGVGVFFSFDPGH
jgi:hypothetical protein